MTDTMFRRLIGKHNEGKTTAKAKKAISQRKGKGVWESFNSKGKVVTCWCCGIEGHYEDKCPRGDRAYCKKCGSKRHYEKACKNLHHLILLQSK